MLLLYSWYLASLPQRSSADFSRMGIPETFVSSSATNAGDASAGTETPGPALALSATPQTPSQTRISPK